jgi:peptidoglycan/LPS O-acetylase OafA/YrhL
MHFTYPAFEAMNAPSEILPNLFLSQSWFSQFNSLSFNYPSWSISVEFGMYLILATVLFAIRDIKCRTAAFAWLASLAAIVMILNIDGTRSLAHAGMFGFSLGIILHFFYTKTHDVVARLPAWFFTLAEIEALVVTYILLTFTLPVPYLTASLGFMAVIYVFTFEGGLFSKLLALKPFQSIGAWSYSIYMIHAAIIFILTIGTQITKHGSILSDTMNAGEHAVLRFFDTGNAVANQILPFLILILVWAISSQTYKYIEVPGQKAFSKK